MTVKVITFGAIVLLLACSHEPPAAAPGEAAATAAHTVSKAGKDDHAHGASHDEDQGQSGKHARGNNKNKSGGKEQSGSGFAVPFVWETSKNDPLAVARGHLKEMLRDNAAYVSAKGKLDPAKITGSARTTIVTCSDAAVQLEALDTTPENDTFVVRNWGNLLEPSLGTVTYGIEELHTPVLLIVGHTGCEAVKSALNGAKFSKPIRSQLSKLKATLDKGKTDGLDVAVIDNVNTQVARAVERFQPLVRTGMLTVIGAIYDPLNALARGQGRLLVVNVNTITDPVSMDAFVTAVTNDDKIVQAVARENDSAHHAEYPGSEHGVDEHQRDTHAAAVDEHNPVGAASEHHKSHEAASPAQKATPPSRPPAAGAAVEPSEHEGARTPSGLPNIDHLEPSLIGEAHPARVTSGHEPAAHAERERANAAHGH